MDVVSETAEPPGRGTLSHVGRPPQCQRRGGEALTALTHSLTHSLTGREGAIQLPPTSLGYYAIHSTQPGAAMQQQQSTGVLRWNRSGAHTLRRSGAGLDGARRAHTPGATDRVSCGALRPRYSASPSASGANCGSGRHSCVTHRHTHPSTHRPSTPRPLASVRGGIWTCAWTRA